MMRGSESHQAALDWPPHCTRRCMMIAARFPHRLCQTAALFGVLAFPLAVRAQDSGAPGTTAGTNPPAAPASTDKPAGAEIDNSKYQFVGKINSNAVYIRSGAS